MTINPVYLRMAVYVFAPMLAAFPGVTVDMAAGLITIDIDTAIAGVGAGLAAAGAVFAKWGKK